MRDILAISALMFGFTGVIDAAQSKAESEVAMAFTNILMLGKISNGILLQQWKVAQEHLTPIQMAAFIKH